MTTGKKVNIDNIIYSSALEASRLLNINHGTIIKRLENPNFKNYIWCDKDMQEKVLNKCIGMSYLVSYTLYAIGCAAGFYWQSKRATRT